MPFQAPKSVQLLLQHYPHSWMIAGGWAIDLYLNRETRVHQDVEIAIPRKDQLKFRAHMPDWNWRYVVDGTFYDWQADQVLQLPIHEIHGHLQEATLEVLLNEIEGDTWRFRRNLEVTYPSRQLVVTSKAGIPALCPEVVLLYKAKSCRDKDHADFRHAVTELSSAQLSWLKGAIKQVHGTNHPWLSDLVNLGDLPDLKT